MRALWALPWLPSRVVACSLVRLSFTFTPSPSRPKLARSSLPPKPYPNQAGDVAGTRFELSTCRSAARLARFLADGKPLYSSQQPRPLGLGPLVLHSYPYSARHGESTGASQDWIECCAHHAHNQPARLVGFG
ncbi:hypothetical protein B0T25DRAFT_194739 [Lasiosphaeria hispida]|uniref:Secreted protein n=1 Tax=Lasiosphaeria hispida TaxID=260671 RepID=A0AAJ0HHJ8_9PEZI|nr:hypothetical protein B0T25DRAFT_194739 [Lasiosphaeria hispida]